MALQYGSYAKPLALPIASIGHGKLKKKDPISGWWTVLRIFVTIAEVAVALIPGVNVAAEAVVGVAAGAVNQYIDAQTGSQSIAGTLLNFAAPIGGAALTGAKNIKTVAKLETGIEYGLAKGLAKTEKTLEVAKEIEMGTDALNRLNNLSKLEKWNYGSNALRQVASIDKPKEFIRKMLQYEKSSKLGFDAAEHIPRQVFEDPNFQKALRSIAANDAEFKLLLETMRKEVRTIEQLRSVMIAMANRKKGFNGVLLLRELANRIDEAAISIVEISPEHLNIIQEIVNSLRFEAPELAFTEMNTWQKAMKIMGTSRFNQRFVQKVQLIDPNDFGRAPVEWLYQKTKKWFNKNVISKLPKVAKNTARIDKAVEEFKRHGGVSVADISDWHIGYKIISTNGLESLVQITYILDSATAEFRHVYVFANKFQLKQYRRSPGRMYRNTWALSLGRKVDVTSMLSRFGKGMHPKDAKQFASLLGFLPVPALRNILSLVSNVVENISDMTTGKWSKQWTSKFTRSFTNSLISRSFRLVGQVGGKYAATKYGKQIYNLVGREFQRAGTTIIGKGIKSSIQGKGFGIDKAPKQLLYNTMVSVRSNTLKHVRRNKSSAIAASLSVRRKMEQYKRIPNAAVPGRPFKGIKIKRR